MITQGSVGTATGFVFNEYTALALADTLNRACEVFADKTVWRQLIKRGMQQDWSWQRSALQYTDLYEQTRQRSLKEAVSA